MLKVAEDVARGMLFLHNQDILHGDLKPNNVLLKQVQLLTGALLPLLLLPRTFQHRKGR